MVISSPRANVACDEKSSLKGGLFEPPQRQSRGCQYHSLLPSIPHRVPTTLPLSSCPSHRRTPAETSPNQEMWSRPQSSGKEGLKRFQNFESSMLQGLVTARMEESGALQVPPHSDAREFWPSSKSDSSVDRQRERHLSISSPSKDRNALSPSRAGARVRARGAQCLALQWRAWGRGRCHWGPLKLNFLGWFKLRSPIMLASWQAGPESNSHSIICRLEMLWGSGMGCRRTGRTGADWRDGQQTECCGAVKVVGSFLSFFPSSQV